MFYNRPHLDKPSGFLGPHTFHNFLDTAIRISNAQYDDQAILQTLNIKVLLTSGEDCGWDIFQLDYLTDSPLETVCYKYLSNINQLKIFNENNLIIFLLLILTFKFYFFCILIYFIYL